VKAKAVELLAKYPENVRKTAEKRLSSSEEWDPDAFTWLCREALASPDDHLKTFCAEVTNFEWKTLFHSCNEIVNKIS